MVRNCLLSLGNRRGSDGHQKLVSIVFLETFANDEKTMVIISAFGYENSILNSFSGIAKEDMRGIEKCYVASKILHWKDKTAGFIGK